MADDAATTPTPAPAAESTPNPNPGQPAAPPSADPPQAAKPDDNPNPLTKLDPAAQEAIRAARAEAKEAHDRAKAAEAQAAKTAAEAKRDRRAMALERLGILPAYRDLAPDVDPSVPAEAASLQQWADARPEIRVKTGAALPGIRPGSPLEAVLAGTSKSPFAGLAALSLKGVGNG